MNQPNQFNKSCATCGLEKPLTAFLEISGPKGTAYGNVCANCRGSSLIKKIIVGTETDDQGSGSSGLKIDAKRKLQMDRDKIEEFKQATEEHRDDLEKRELATEEKVERSDLKEKAEKKHRTDFIDSKKKGSFLNYFNQKPSEKNPSVTSAKETVIAKSALDQAAALTSQHQEGALKEETIAKTLDTANVTMDAPTATFVRSSEMTERLKKWLGSSAAMNTYQRQFLSNPSDPTKQATLAEGAKQTATVSEKHDPQKQTNELNKAAENKDPLMEYPAETWDPLQPRPIIRRR